ncbi:MAG TPA: thioredoxin family protein [Dehalococcoidia bacterium]|nr:thioredoxin family protein [Dehalococcoidia bacterium]
MIPLRDQELLRQRFQRDLTSRIRIDYFTQKPSSLFLPGREACPFCEECRTLMEEIASLSDRIALTVHDLSDSAEAAKELGVDKVPAVVIRGQTNRPLRFFGLPSGNQFPVLIETLIEASTGKVDLQPETQRQLRKLKTDVRLQVLVTPTCQHSPPVAHLAYKLALQSVRIKVDVIEAVEFPSLATRLALRATPTLYIEDKLAIPGAMDETRLVQDVLRVVEGKPFTSETRTSNATIFTPPGQQPAQTQPQRIGSSGLILPR